jgi:hypothetical protein
MWSIEKEKSVYYADRNRLLRILEKKVAATVKVGTLEY